MAILETSEFQVQVTIFDGMTTLSWRPGLYSDEIKQNAYRAMWVHLNAPGHLVPITEQGLVEMADIVRQVLRRQWPDQRDEEPCPHRTQT